MIKSQIMSSLHNIFYFKRTIINSPTTQALSDKVDVCISRDAIFLLVVLEQFDETVDIPIVKLIDLLLTRVLRSRHVNRGTNWGK